MKTHWLIVVLTVLCLLLVGAVAFAAEGPPAVEVHGWALTRYYLNTTVDATRNDLGEVSDKETKSHLAWERFSLYSIARLANDKQVYAEVYIHPWLPNDDPSFLYLESLYIDLSAAENARVRIGKGRNLAFGIVPTYGNRKTSNYSPLSEVFTMDRAVGIQYAQKSGPNTLNVGLFNSQRVGARLIGMAADSQMDKNSVARTTVPHLVNRDTPADRSDELEISARVGRQMSDLNVGLSGRIGAIDDTDASVLASRFPDDYNGTNKTRRYYGVDAVYRRMPWFASAEYYAGTLGGIGQDGYALVLGLEPTRDCTGFLREMSRACRGVYVRYVNLDIDATATVNNPYTWDTRQWAVSYVLPIRSRHFPLVKWLQFEYERNIEKVPEGADQAPNDMFFVEMFTAF